MNPDPGSFSNPSDNSQCFFCHTKTAFKIFQHKSFLSHPVHSQCIFTRIISRHFQIAYLISMLKDMRTRRNDRLLLLNYVTIYIYELSDNSIYTNELSYTPLYWHVHTWKTGISIIKSLICHNVLFNEKNNASMSP